MILEQKGKAEGKSLRPQKGGHQKQLKVTQEGALEIYGFLFEPVIGTVPDDVKKCNFWRFREMVGYIGIAPACYLRQHSWFESRHLSKIRKWAT